MEFFLQLGITESSRYLHKRGERLTLPEPREFLDDFVHKGATVIKVYHAASWIAARHKVIG